MTDQDIKDSTYDSIVGFYENNLTNEQADELISFLKKEKENLTVFQEIGKIWLASGIIAGKKQDSEEAWLKLQERIRNSGSKPLGSKVVSFRLVKLIQFAAAVALLVIIGAGALYLLGKKTKGGVSNFVEAVAPKGSRSIITLSDGSTVWLNSDTKIRYNQEFGRTSRELYLEGEAYFVVAENKAVPFRVITSDIAVTALGTSFNVKAYNDENVIETTLETGEIRIDQVALKKQKLVADPVFLKPNQKAVFTKENLRLSVDNNGPEKQETEDVSSIPVRHAPVLIDTLVDTKLSTSWKDSRWIFRREQLRKLKPILERRYDITIVFKDSSLCNYKFTGTIKEESLDQVLKALSLAAPIKYNIDHNLVTLSEDPGQRSRYHRPQKTLN